MRVAALGKAVLEGLAQGGVVGVVKHIPGHGRAGADSHLELPVVTATLDELTVDLEPFEKLKDAPMAMTAHVVYTALDPDRCATLSPVVINDIIRRRIGFDGDRKRVVEGKSVSVRVDHGGLRIITKKK